MKHAQQADTIKSIRKETTWKGKKYSRKTEYSGQALRWAP